MIHADNLAHKLNYLIKLLPNLAGSGLIYCATLTEAMPVLRVKIKRFLKKDYDPPITLVNTKSDKYPEFIQKLSIAYTPFEDIFVIALGKSDEIGQFLGAIQRYELGERINCRL